VKLLLRHGADPNGMTDSGGNSVYAAKTKEIGALLEGTAASSILTTSCGK
jgi:hypothetical protein